MDNLTSNSFNSNSINSGFTDSKYQFDDKKIFISNEKEGDFQTNIEGGSYTNASNSNSLNALNNIKNSNSTNIGSHNSNNEENNNNSLNKINDLMKAYYNSLNDKYQ